MSRATLSDEADLARKIEVLSRPETYPHAAQVETRETHMSWVFLTECDAYKLKKPVKFPYLDYSSLRQRQRMCELEVSLNRRLAPSVYLGTLALVEHPDGHLSLMAAGLPHPGRVVEVLVHMRRLPDALMLDHAIRSRTLHLADVVRVAQYLADFFRHARPAHFGPGAYVARLRKAVDDNLAGIAAADASADLASIGRRLHSFLDAHQCLLETRVEAGRLVEGHGDLRPEHVFLGLPSAVLDCIEFSHDLRLNDPVEELAFLHMECLALGDPHCGERFLRIYCDRTRDEVPEGLLRFHMQLRACLRARLALGHLGDTTRVAHWRHRAASYLELASSL